MSLPREENQLRGILLRSLGVWMLIILVETVHGILRGILLVPIVGDFRARQLSVLTGSLLILLVTFCTIRWIRARTKPQLLQIGLLWVGLTMSFEIILGRLVLNLPWDRLTVDYDLSRGGLLGIGMILLGFAPLIASRYRRGPTE